MKKIALMLVFAVIVIAANAQAYRVVTASEADTNKNAETDYIVVPNNGSFMIPQSLTIQVACIDQYGGTSDGTLTIEGSIDGTYYKNLTTEEYPDLKMDTITIAPNVVATWVIPKTYFSKYRIKAVGTANDTTLFKPRYKVQEYK